MTDSAPLLPIDAAQARLFALAPPIATEHVALRDAAGRWAAESVHARRTQPAADLSAMDGYALRFADLPGPFRLIGESAAGHPFAGQVGAGETVRISTGAALPGGSDTVLVQEEARREGDAIHLDGDGPAFCGRNVRVRGLDFNTGDLLFAAGARITPARLALAATAGLATLPVRRPIRVATLATGDELVPPGTPVTGSQLPESNALMLAALFAGLPIDLAGLGIVPDNLDALTRAFASCSTTADLIVTTGGASVGDHDLIRPALIAAGGSVDYWRIALRPGKPMLAGRLGDAVVLALPGNPVSAFVTALLFVRPMIAALAGAADPLPVTAAAILGDDLPANGDRTDYLRAEQREGRVHTATIQDSSMLATLARANCLVVRAPHAPPAQAGDMVQILPLA
ncbi:molybdopterin molybdotransferase MoeA [Hephaestia sp. GCM10023244]|uniref:molybdopterin molybdotransferase MoeA n=1 Tax=unclassified Hephaestia TaxID=2631281 RepID=UPI002077268F|nr:molybdopterin molybdotransferase MoeA [Hephaestia sp. MAHUQ-44]